MRTDEDEGPEDGPDDNGPVGDAERDMLAARSAGMHGVLATFGYLDPEAGWHAWPRATTIAHLGELLPWLRSRGLCASVAIAEPGNLAPS